MKRVAFFVVVAALAAYAWLVLRPAMRSRAAEGTPPRVDVTTAAGRLPEHRDAALEAELAAIVSHVPARCAIVAKHLGTGAIVRVNADTLIPLMSVVKLPVALAVLEKVDQGEWTLETPVTLLPQDMHPRGWVGDRYPRGGGPLSVHKLLSEMLMRSDNSSADALMRLLGGPHAVTRWLERHGIRDFRVDRTERALGNDWYGLAPDADTMGSAEDIRKLRAQMPAAVQDSAVRAMFLDPRDSGSAEACVDLLERLWRGELLSRPMTDTLEAMLARCKTAPHRIPALLPKGTPVARKTGTGGTWKGVTVAINDIGVVRLPNGDDVAIAVLLGEPRGSVHRAEKVIARVARAVFDAWGGGGALAGRAHASAASTP